MTRLSVMIVEDDFHVAAVNKEIIQNIDGFTVETVQLKGKDAVKYLASHHVDLAVVDVFLPDSSGLDVIREIRQRDLDTDVILITAANDGNTIMNAIRMGSFDYIMKPFSKERLEQAIEKFRNYRSRLESGAGISKSAVSGLMRTEQKDGGATNLQKGISSFTLQRVQGYFLGSDTRVTIQELATTLRLSRITARRYLEYLHQQGEIAKTFEYSDIGRPHAVYSVGIRD